MYTYLMNMKKKQSQVKETNLWIKWRIYYVALQLLKQFESMIGDWFFVLF